MMVKITWNGQGGELDSVTVDDRNDNAVREALITLVEGNIVSAGDTFVIEEVS